MSKIEYNEKILQVRGKLSTDKDYQMGDDVDVTVCITSIEDFDDQNGKLTKIYKGKLFNENE